jgi:hypothetical protein
VELQPREWTLLEVMLANEGRILTKKFLLEKVWDIQFDPGTNVVDAMICRLRRKIDAPRRCHPNCKPSEAKVMFSKLFPERMPSTWRLGCCWPCSWPAAPRCASPWQAGR